MSIKEIIDAALFREDRTGTGVVTNDPQDKGGRTQWGITERDNPDLWADGVVTRDEAAARFAERYVFGPGFDKIPDPKLQSLLVDFGINSGPKLAIMKLQEILRVTQDGILGPKTLAAIAAEEPRRLTNQLSLARIKMIGRIVKRDPSQLKWINGWLDRAGEFVE